MYAADGQYHKSLNSNAVTSVNSLTGTVVLDSDDISEGSTNLYFSDARAQAAITGAASSIATIDLTANRALISNGSGKVSVSSVGASQLVYLGNVTSDIQAQINGKQASGNYITDLTGDVTASGPGSSTATLASVGTAGTYGTVTTDAKGRVTSGTVISAVANGGTNSGTALNNNRLMVSSSGAIVEAAALTNGQLLIGSTGAAPVAAAITAGAGITVTNGAGSISVAVSAL